MHYLLSTLYTVAPMPDPERILVVQPSWVGEAVMATPTLRAIRNLYPRAHISFLLRRYVKPIYAGMPWADKLITYRTGRTKAKAGKGQFFDLAARLRRGRFDLAILLPNSFKSALVCKIAPLASGFIPSTPMPSFKRTGTTFCWKLRKCASMTLSGICTASKRK